MSLDLIELALQNFEALKPVRRSGTLICLRHLFPAHRRLADHHRLQDVHIIRMSNKMTLTKLDALPKELIAHIACCSDVESVVQLSVTCKTIRAAAYDSLVFKHILLNRQKQSWKPESLDAEAISERAGSSTTAWARYALADEVALELSGRECPLEIPQRFVNCLPELFAVKHPFMYHDCWKRFLRKPLDQKSNQIFCLAMAILASEQDMPQVRRSLQMQNDSRLSRDDSMKGFLWALCTVALTLRTTLRARLAAWPYNNNANIPHITFPRATRIPLRPLDDSYSLPLPFSRRAVELLGRSTSSFSGWDSWFDQHNAAFVHNSANLTEGRWCGYYVHFGVQAEFLDPPMIEIRFQLAERQGHQPDIADAIIAHIEALNCRDGIDTFDIIGDLRWREREIEFRGQKQYHSGAALWDWDLRLTPFGLVGYWGSMQDHGRLTRYGIVWLWKKEWSDVTA
jgi:hypothetical protein